MKEMSIVTKAREYRVKGVWEKGNDRLY